ncbi:hypothetical protein VTN00DRAFT_8166 [Thermoascus crustaceus]|uniref:uncharacterized protein n=1 Tax=Thermoascus crustaceus TaxID=5088 RepID=UPI0037445B14
MLRVIVRCPVVSSYTDSDENPVNTFETDLTEPEPSLDGDAAEFSDDPLHDSDGNLSDIPADYGKSKNTILRRASNYAAVGLFTHHLIKVNVDKHVQAEDLDKVLKTLLNTQPAMPQLRDHRSQEMCPM